MLEGGMEERKASSSGTEEMRVGVNAEVVMLSGWQCQENEGSVSSTHEQSVSVLYTYTVYNDGCHRNPVKIKQRSFPAPSEKPRQ